MADEHDRRRLKKIINNKKHDLKVRIMDEANKQEIEGKKKHHVSCHLSHNEDYSVIHLEIKARAGLNFAKSIAEIRWHDTEGHWKTEQRVRDTPYKEIAIKYIEEEIHNELDNDRRGGQRITRVHDYDIKEDHHLKKISVEKQKEEK